MNEQRNFRRINFQTEAMITVDATPQPCELVDLALQGALFKIDSELPTCIGERYPITISLAESDLTMNFTGELIHQRGNYYGFIFVAEDAVTMGHLRRLLELNFGDSEEVDREFHHWLKR